MSRSSSQSAVTPINTLKSEVQNEKPMQATSRFHRGYPKRFREKFSDASDSDDSEDEASSDDDTTTQSTKVLTRNPWWNPMGWIMRYQTTFGSQSGEIADGPFKGYIPFGPRAGTYLPSYGPPSDKKLAEAEKTAVLKDAWSDCTPGDSTAVSSDVDDDVSESEDTDGEDVEDNSIPKKNESDEGVSTGSSLEGLVDSRHLAVPDRGHGVVQSRSGRPIEIPSSQTPDLSITSTSEDKDVEDVSSLLRNIAAERAERLDRTTQYILTGNRTQERPSSNTHVLSDASDSTSQKLPSNLAPATTPAVNSSTPSGVSETTSIQIAQQLTQDSQLTQDNAPPSNQELGILLSSSPSRASNPRKATPAKAKAKAKARIPRVFAGPDHDDAFTTSSTEPSAGIPARLPPKTPPRKQRSVPSTPEVVAASPQLEHHSPSADFILNGIAHRRSTRLMSVSSAIRPNYSFAGLESSSNIPAPDQSPSKSPSRPAREVLVTSKNDEVLPSKDGKDEAPSSHAAAGISIELPTMTTEKQAEYETVSAAVSTPASPEQDLIDDPHPLKSFEAINKVSAGADVSTPEPRDASEEALEYVLRESPKWLNSITQVASTDPSTKLLADSNTTKEERLSSRSVARARRSSVVNGDKNMDDSVLVPADRQSVTPVPLPVTPTFPDLNDERVSQQTPRSKKRKRASTANEVVPLASNPLVSLLSDQVVTVFLRIRW